MARLFTCGFEENDLTLTMWTFINGTTPTIVSAVPTPHSGTFCLTTPNAAGNSSVRRALSASKGSGSTVFTRFYWQTTNVTPAVSTILMVALNSGASTLGTLALQTTGAIRLTNNITTTFSETSTGILSANTWYRLELDYFLSATVGTMALRVYLGDNTVSIGTASIGPENTISANFLSFQYGKGSTGVVTFSYDDIAINDDVGGFQNANPGPGKIALITPNSDVAVAWTKAGSAPAGTNFGGVSEVPGTPDDAVTFNTDSGTSNVDRLGLTGLPAEVLSTSAIILVDVYARGTGGAASQTMITRLWDEGGTPTDGPTISLANGTYNFTDTASHLVFDASGKTKANVNSFNVGYKGASGVSAKRVTDVWVNVEWSPAAGGPVMGPLNQYDWPNPAPKPFYLENRSWLGTLSFLGLDQFFGEAGQVPTFEFFNPGLGAPRPNLGTTQGSNFGLLTHAIPQGAAVFTLPPRGAAPINVGATYNTPVELLNQVFPMPRFNGAGQPDFPNPQIPIRNVALLTFVNPTTILPTPPSSGDANWVPTWMPRRGR